MTEPTSVYSPPAVDQSLRTVFGQTLAELADTDPRILVLDADVGSSTRLDLFEEVHPKRYLPMGIAEQNMFGVAAGLAAIGYVPFPTTFAVFAAKRGLDQIRVLIAQPRLPVKIVAGFTGLLTGKTGKTHQPVQDISVMRSMPNMVVINPGDRFEMRDAIRATVEYDGPVYLRVYREAAADLFDSQYRFRLGAAIKLRDGGDVALISSGPQTGRVVQAAKLLAVQGVNATVVHVPTIKPLDTAAIVAAADATGFVVTVEEHSIIGGLGGAVAETLGELRPTWIHRIGLRDTYGESGSDDVLLDKYGLTPPKVAEQVVAALQARRG